MVNADEFARQINAGHPEAESAAAGRLALQRLSDLISAQRSFGYETTLSSNQALALMARARKAGFRVELVFVLLRSADLNVARVKQRVAMGGHDIPASTILRRYDRAFKNLSEAIPIAHQAIFYDNTGTQLKPLLRIDHGQVSDSGLDQAQPIHQRLVTIVAAALKLAPSAILGAGL